MRGFHFNEYTNIQAKCSFSTFSDYRVKYCFNRGPLAPEFNQSGTSHLGKLAIQFSVEHHIWDRSNIWDSLCDFTSGKSSFGTTHLGQFMRLYIWDGVWKGTTHLGQNLSVTFWDGVWNRNNTSGRDFIRYSMN